MQTNDKLFLNEFIYSRVLNTEIREGEQWKETAQCWICNKWQKVSICYQREDEQIMKENLNKLTQLREVIELYFEKKNNLDIEIIDKEEQKEI